MRNDNPVLSFWIPAISGVFAVADWVAVRRRQRPLEFVCKPAVMVALVAVALRLHPDSGSQRAWFVVALALSLAGDVALMLDQFEAGLASFLGAHVAYIGGFVALGLSVPRLLGALEVLAVVGVIVGGPILRAVRRSSPPLVGPVAVYMTAISVMVACAAASGRWLAVLGAVLFYVSDATIAWNRFVQPFDSAKVLIIVTYHLAQFALVASLVW